MFLLVQQLIQVRWPVSQKYPVVMASMTDYKAAVIMIEEVPGKLLPIIDKKNKNRG